MTFRFIFFAVHRASRFVLLKILKYILCLIFDVYHDIFCTHYLTCNLSVICWSMIHLYHVCFFSVQFKLLLATFFVSFFLFECVSSSSLLAYFWTERQSEKTSFISFLLLFRLFDSLDSLKLSSLDDVYTRSAIYVKQLNKIFNLFTSGSGS